MNTNQIELFQQKLRDSYITMRIISKNKKPEFISPCIAKDIYKLD